MYYIVYAFFYLVSLLPLRVLHFISDSLYGIVYHVIRYRRKVVMHNLLIAFPEKTDAERVAIAKGFYHKLFDSMLESLKLLSAPDTFFEKRFSGNWELINQYYDAGRPVQVHLGHNFNWEWGNTMIAKKVKHQYLGVYLPLSNKIFDRLFKKMRSRGGAVLIPATNMTKAFLPYRKTLYCMGLIADQSPGRIDHTNWFDFFGRKTAFITGSAKMAMSTNAVVAFATIKRVKRGYYRTEFEIAAENPKNKTDIEITQQFVNYLETNLRQAPDNWLWSHRRWKHEWNESYASNVN
ncbi:lysophospholipid acyltransferase family protein [Niabella insulamsoli]|uniref:lysophospholipid acyltransferase family protein n=1 Tax=Niabella insulamsoli TaxID=3144874 RepID=UPI0031FE405E